MRKYLENGTYLEVPGKIRYKIIGAPIGMGGCSVIYTAKKYIPTADGLYSESPLDYAIKECYPDIETLNIYRDDTGSIVAGNQVASDYLDTIKRMQMNEADVSGRIFNVGFRTTPVLETYEQVSILNNEGKLIPTNNMISVLGSLSEKGKSLRALLSTSETGKLNAEQTFRIAEQLLYAIDEVHKAGYLHLDIQDGNVFLHGSLENRNNMVSLLDFGTARKLEDDGLSCEIDPKEIYSTQGFTAPEILLCKNQKLKLDRAADLYSIGALMLCLLTGHKSSSQELIGNDGKNYVPKFVIPSTNCPKHLVAKMQAIITKALTVSLDERYSNATEMLEDVTDFLNAIAPYRNPLTSNSYDAFICYRHNELDNLAARSLRDSLERFKAKSPNGKDKLRIKSVFMDEGELSSCADFGERINDALKKSKWLIVICSGDTKESRWVNEEIRTFLKYHDKSHVLAVVTDGEPEEVYPYELKRNGLDASTLFAADARANGDLNRTKRLITHDVKLRIAAAILETTYDSLKQRRRSYELKLLAGYAAIVTLMLGFAVFTTVQVKTEHTKFLESQSEYMKEQAFQAYTDNNTPEVLKSALAKYDIDKELNKNDGLSIQLMSEVLHLYKEPGSSASIEPYDTWTPDEGKDNAGLFVVLESGKYIATADMDYGSSRDRDCIYKIYIWDANNRKVITSFESDIFTKEMFIDGHRSLIADWSNKTIACYDYISKKTEWTCDCEFANSVVLSPDNKHLIVGGEDSKWLLYNLDKKTWSQIAQGNGKFGSDAEYYNCSFNSDGNLIVIKTEGVGDLWSFAGLQTNSMFDAKCISIDDNSTLWEYSKDFICQENSAYAVAVEGYIGLVYGNTIDYIDNGGKLLQHIEEPSHISDFLMYKDKRFDVLLTDGSICSVSKDGSNTWLNTFPNRSRYCYFGKGCIYVRTMRGESFGCNQEILIYKPIECDENYVEIEKNDVPDDLLFEGCDMDLEYANSIQKELKIKGKAESIAWTPDRKYAVFYFKDHMTMVNTETMKKVEGDYDQYDYYDVACEHLRLIDDNTLLGIGRAYTSLSFSGDKISVTSAFSSYDTSYSPDEDVFYRIEDDNLEYSWEYWETGSEIYKSRDEYNGKVYRIERKEKNVSTEVSKTAIPKDIVYDSPHDDYYDQEYLSLIKDKCEIKDEAEEISWTGDRKYIVFYFKNRMILVNTETWKKVEGDYGAYDWNRMTSSSLKLLDENTLIGVDRSGDAFTFIHISDDSISIVSRIDSFDMAYSPKEDAFFFVKDDKNECSWEYWNDADNYFGYKTLNDWDASLYRIRRYQPEEIVEMARNRV